MSTAAAANAAGRRVIVWSQPTKFGKSDIFVQVYAPDFTPDGSPRNLTNSYMSETTPSVGMASDGSFIVAWVQTLSNGDTNIQARRYAVTGDAASPMFSVSATSLAESQPNVAVAAGGNFVIAYTVDNGGNFDLRARKYDAATTGDSAGSLTIGNSATANETWASGAYSDGGRYAVAFQMDADIYLRRYTTLATSAATTTLGTTAVAKSPIIEATPSLAMKSDLRVAIVWQEQMPSVVTPSMLLKGTRGCTVSAGGFASTVQTIQSPSDFGQANAVHIFEESIPRIAINAITGRAVVTVTDNHYDRTAGLDNHCYNVIYELAANMAPLSNSGHVTKEMLVDPTSFIDHRPIVATSVSMDGEGDYVVSGVYFTKSAQGASSPSVTTVRGKMS